MRRAATSACWRRRRRGISPANWCRCSTRRASCIRPTTACARIRPLENLAKLRPFFDRKYGNVTAGNSSQITDGGAWVVIASARAVEQHKLTPIGRIVDSQWAGLDPAQMGLGPVHAATPILQRHNLGAERPRRLGDQRSVRRAGHRVRTRVGQRRLLPHRTRPARARSARSTRASSMSTAARSRWDIPSAPRARASFSTC